jgi:hypothetical protein
MSMFDEKRKLSDRRISNQGPPFARRERRTEDNRRQTLIAEISFHEWAAHFVKFLQRNPPANDARSAAHNRAAG